MTIDQTQPTELNAACSTVDETVAMMETVLTQPLISREVQLAAHQQMYRLLPRVVFNTTCQDNPAADTGVEVMFELAESPHSRVRAEAYSLIARLFDANKEAAFAFLDSVAANEQKITLRDKADTEISAIARGNIFYAVHVGKLAELQSRLRSS